jgi:hypothetical protein
MIDLFGRADMLLSVERKKIVAATAVFFGSFYPATLSSGCSFF